jgi:lipoprotein-anchoring transpeptidase ErfK/SrfK
VNPPAKRGVALASTALLALAGGVLAFAFATPVAGADEGTTTTTEPAPVTTTAPSPPPLPAGPRLLAPGITIGGTLVGGLSVHEAEDVLRAAFEAPLQLVVSPTRTITVDPREVGASVAAAPAVRRALAYRRALNVPLGIEVSTARVERFSERLGGQLDKSAVDSHWALRKLKPFPTRAVTGRRLNRVLTTRAVVQALRTHRREPIQLAFKTLEPKVTEDTIGHSIVIRRGDNHLLLYDGAGLVRRFQVATGRSSYPTPLGHFEIVIKERNPWWYPPAGSAWAAGEKPVPPGPGNPLGTRWMGISAPNVGIHGTPDAASVGYSASHGCIRMRIPEAEWLFQHVEVGDQVFIVAV